MATYKVKLGHHGINGKIYKTGDVVEVKNEKMAEGDGARFFEKIVEQPAVADPEGGKRGKGKGKAAEAAAAAAAAQSATGEAPANPEA